MKKLLNSSGVLVTAILIFLAILTVWNVWVYSQTSSLLYDLKQESEERSQELAVLRGRQP